MGQGRTPRGNPRGERRGSEQDSRRAETGRRINGAQAEQKATPISRGLRGQGLDGGFALEP
jgi:hypothetical protein